MYTGLHVKCTLFLSALMKLEFSRHFFWKNNQILNFVEILSVGTELFHGDRRTHRHAFPNSAEAPKTNIGKYSTPHVYTAKLIAEI